MVAGLYAYAFCGDLVLLYPVYALLFAHAGLSTAAISSLFAIWSLTGFVLEVPSGVLADRTSRRALLVAGPLLAAAGFAAWVVAPSYPVFAAGFVLWGACGALQSGSLEALVYEELARGDATARYAHVIGRAHALATVASAVAMGLAAPALALGGFTALGAASVVACLIAAGVATTLPEHRAPARRDAVRLARPSRHVAAAVLLVAAVAAIWGALDEYLPLLAAATGVATATVPLLALVVYGGVAAGGILGGRAARLSNGALAALLAAAAVALAMGAASGSPAGFALIAVAFGAFQAATIAVEARLQEAIDGPARATLTSLAGLATEAVVLGVYAVYGAGSAFASHRALFVAFAGVYAVVAVAWIRR